MEILIFFIFLIPFFLSCYAILRVRINGSDNAYHLIMIDAIAENNNKFISKMPYFVGTPRHSYPQLLHWLFSLIPSKKRLKFARFTGVFFNFLIGISLYFLSTYFYNHYLEDSGIHYTNFMFLTACVFAFSPVQYDLVNAKNVGFSARGLGLFLGNLFLFSILFYIYENHFVFLLLASILAFVILLSSTFAIQFLILFSIVISIFFKNIFLLIPLFSSILGFYIIMPKVAISFFKGQIIHKKRFYKIIGPMGILKTRYSIWRDFIYDFWIKGVAVYKNKISIVEWAKYVSTNPFVNLIIGMPFIILFLIKTPYSATPILDKLILSTLVLFLLTSFRKTRFIGEPERYAEFSLGLLAISIAVNYHSQPSNVYYLFVLCVLFIIGRIYISKSVISKNTNAITRDVSLLFKATLEEISKKSKIRVLCNSSQITKMLLSNKYQTFRHPIFNNTTGSFSFKDLYTNSYAFLKPSVIKPIINEFTINYYVYLGDFNDLKDQKDFQLIQKEQDISLYKIIH